MSQFPAGALPPELQAARGAVRGSHGGEKLRAQIVQNGVRKREET